VAVAVLDASAVVALVMRERGFEVVRRVVTAGAVVASTGMTETLATCRRKGHRRTSDDLMADLIELGIRVEPLIEDDCLEMDFLLRRSDQERARNPELGALSLGDVACIAIARRLKLPVVASDGTWELLDVGVTILAFR
jgi:PIN domain nuclease of toxin-antitoxin system